MQKKTKQNKKKTLEKSTSHSLYISFMYHVITFEIKNTKWFLKTYSCLETKSNNYAMLALGSVAQTGLRTKGSPV